MVLLIGTVGVSCFWGSCGIIKQLTRAVGVSCCSLGQLGYHVTGVVVVSCYSLGQLWYHATH